MMEETVTPAIIGNIRKPDRIGETPATSCRNSGMYTVAPNIAIPARKLMTLVTRITGLRNRRSGSTGSSVRPSCQTKRTQQNDAADEQRR